MRKQFQLPEGDEECLVDSRRPWEALAAGKVQWLILPGYKIPDGYNVATATAALKIPPKYPDEQIDMVYFAPPLSLNNGRTVNNLSLTQIDGRDFQQWSRHRTGENPWRPGVDCICTHLLQVDTWLARELNK
ncbi:E2/UBC family protein [Mesorhizobium sp. M1273]|uniref:E2/UBC family protein n=1 Tax=Mesorhizobium sp. M1273 TaxID=2957075 RepID=UPI0033382899